VRWGGSAGVTTIGHDHFAPKRPPAFTLIREMVARATISRLVDRGPPRSWAKWSWLITAPATPTNRIDLLDLQRPPHPRTPRRPHPRRPQRTNPCPLLPPRRSHHPQPPTRTPQPRTRQLLRL